MACKEHSSCGILRSDDHRGTKASLQVLKHVTFSDTVSVKFYDSPYIDRQFCLQMDINVTGRKHCEGLQGPLNKTEKLIASSFHDHWCFDSNKGVADSTDILRWFNEMLTRTGHTKWKMNSRQWAYVQWKFNIPNTEAKVWMLKKLAE